MSQLRYIVPIMATQTSMLHVRIDEQVKAQATEHLANLGLTVSDAVRILLTRVAKEGGLPPGFTSATDDYDAWFRAKVREALDDQTGMVTHSNVMTEAQQLIDKKRHQRAAD